MKHVAKRIWGKTLIIVFIVTLSSSCATIPKSVQKTSSKYEPGYKYDARVFLSRTQTNPFNKIYPNFDDRKLEIDWEWKDVDPLALFTPEQNRKRRRELFLYEYSPNTLLPSEKIPSQAQLAFKVLLQNRFPEVSILMTSRTLKLISRYESSYDDLPTLRKPELTIPPFGKHTRTNCRIRIAMGKFSRVCLIHIQWTDSDV